MSTDTSLWIFGYGSLMWRPAFPHVASSPAYIRGWQRLFWQGSTDHRGVPGAPGRVVTLLPGPEDALCWGRAFCVAPAEREAVLDALDYREKGGYRRETVVLHLADGRQIADGLLYLATPDNPNYLGPLPLASMVAQVRRSRGPSGDNVEYVFRLDEALAEMGVTDPVVRELADALRRAEG